MGGTRRHRAGASGRNVGLPHIAPTIAVRSSLFGRCIAHGVRWHAVAVFCRRFARSLARSLRVARVGQVKQRGADEPRAAFQVGMNRPPEGKQLIHAQLPQTIM
jgi:hypothetical protein